MTVEVSEPPISSIDVDELTGFAERILAGEGIDGEAHLAITFVDLDTMAALNEEHLSTSGPTDVLSFPIEDAAPGDPPTVDPEGPPLLLGDIILSADVIAEHAAEFGVSFDDELHLMVCHGVLHILGWDHETDETIVKLEASRRLGDTWTLLVEGRAFAGADEPDPDDSLEELLDPDNKLGQFVRDDYLQFEITRYF